MKRILYLSILFCICLFCVSCKKTEDDYEFTPREDEEIPQQIVLQEEIKEETHSEFYLEDYAVEDVIRYFNEVVLQTEYGTGTGDSTLVQRWDTPICYQIVGDAVAEDREVLENMFAELNMIEGFPGVHEAKSNEEPNLHIYFEGREDFDVRFSDFLGGEYADGATRYWYYTDTNDIYTGTIGYCTDMPSENMKSVLLEEVVNCLGLGDSVLREDSIVYQYSNETKELSEMDWLILRLMYNQRIRCGMDAMQCEEIIRELYY